MKKLFLVGALALFTAANAQMEKGSWVVGGSTTLGFNSATTKLKYDGETEDGPKVSTITLTPSVGYFVGDNIAIGLDLGLSSVTQKEGGNSYSSKQTTSTFSIMPTATYYFRSASKVVPYLGIGAGYGSVTQKYTETFGGTTESDEESVGGISYKGKGGVVFLINQNVGIDLGVAYTGVNGKLDSDDEVKVNTGTFGANVGISVFFK